jgi:hypothetical protein
LDSGQSPLQSHPGINVGFGQESTLAASVLIVLGEDQVPYLGEATTVTIRLAFSFATPKLSTKVVMNLATWSTGTRITDGTPEVVFITESQYLARRNANLPPIGKRLFIVKINRYPQPFLGQLQILRTKLPGPGNSLSFKIITDAEIAKHLEEREVLAITHQIYVSGAKAFLAGS